MRWGVRFCFGNSQGGRPADLPFPLTLLNDFTVFSSVSDLVIHCWAPLSWSSPLISTKLISSLPRFLLPCSRLNWKRGEEIQESGVWVGDQEMSPRIQSLWNDFRAPRFHCTLNSLCAVHPFTMPPTKLHWCRVKGYFSEVLLASGKRRSKCIPKHKCRDSLVWILLKLCINCICLKELHTIFKLRIKGTKTIFFFQNNSRISSKN